MSYTPYAIDLTPQQLRKLAKGEKVRIKYSQFDDTGSVDTVMLTQTQIKQVEKARKANKGFELHFSATQIDAQGEVGSGKFSSWFKTIGTALKNKVIDSAIRYAPGAVETLGTLAKGAVRMGAEASGLPEYGKAGLTAFADEGIRAGEKWSKEQLLAFLNGLRSTSTGSGLFSLQPHGVDLQSMLAGLKTRPKYDLSGGSLFPPTGHRGGSLFLPTGKR
jgi:hypothetical protein